MLTQQAIIDFCNQYDYDIRKSGNGRWIDQKLTLDVLSFIADCILQFTEDDPSKEFKVKDIWMYNYCVDPDTAFELCSPKRSYTGHRRAVSAFAFALQGRSNL